MTEVLSVSHDSEELLWQEPEAVTEVVVKPEEASLQGLLRLIEVDSTSERFRSRAFANLPRQRMAPQIGQLITLRKEVPRIIHD